MAEPDKQQLGDGHDNYGQAAQQAAKAAAAKGAEAAAKGAEATANAAAATVQAGVQAGGSAVSEVAVGTASGGPWGAIIAAAWSMRKTLFKVLVCVCLVLVFIIVIIVSLPSIIWDYLFGTDDSPPVQNTSITEIYNEMADAVSVVVNGGLDASRRRFRRPLCGLHTQVARLHDVPADAGRYQHRVSATLSWGRRDTIALLSR